MARTSLLQGLTVLLLAWALVHCQAPLEPQEEEEEDDPMEETEIENFLVPAVAKVEPVVCPGECSCTEEGAVDCAGVDLMDFPSELSESTRILSLQNNRIEILTVEDLARLQQLETLNLQNNRLTTQGKN
nr:podocan-like [Oncorhynchus nerka]